MKVGFTSRRRFFFSHSASFELGPALFKLCRCSLASPLPSGSGLRARGHDLCFHLVWIAWLSLEATFLFLFLRILYVILAIYCLVLDSEL